MSYQDVSRAVGEVYLCSDNEGKSRIDGIQVKQVNVRPNARIIKHPIETGGVVMDNKVLDPKTINIRVAVVWKADKSHEKALSELDKLWEDRTYNFCSIRTRKQVYKNLKMVSEPHTETPDRFNVFEFDLQFEEMMFGTKIEAQPANADNSSTKSNGQIQGS